jgi:thioredoxin-related protein
MLKILRVIAIFTLMSTLLYSEQTGKLSGASEHEVPSWFKQSFLDISEDVAEAKKNNKHLMLFIDLDGCPYCTKMLNESFFASNPTSDFIKKHFDVVNLNVKGSREVTWDEKTTLSEKDLAIKLGVEYSPTVLFLDENKKVVLRLNGTKSNP